MAPRSAIRTIARATSRASATCAASGLPFASVPPRLERRIRQRRRPVQRRSQETTEAILTATLQVLLDGGYAALTTTRVAHRAGVSVGTLYQYFPDKRSLVAALEVRYLSLMVEAVRGAQAPAGAPLPALLRSALGAVLEVKRRHLPLTLALRGADELDGDFSREALQPFVEALLPIAGRASPAPPAHTARRVTLLVAALEGALSYAAYQAPQWLEEPWLIDDLVALSVGHLAGPVTPHGATSATGR